MIRGGEIQQSNWFLEEPIWLLFWFWGGGGGYLVGDQIWHDSTTEIWRFEASGNGHSLQNRHSLQHSTLLSSEPLVLPDDLPIFMPQGTGSVVT